MPKRATCEVLRDNLAQQPAAQAWSRLRPERNEPEGIEVLQPNRKTAVYRLIGAGPDGSAVIAKRCLRATGLVERLIYEECLAVLPVRAPKFYGFLEDPAGGEFCWLFLEDAGGQRYSPQNAEHRAAAARWLGIVHAFHIEEAITRLLPDRGPRHYLQLVRSSRAMAMKSVANPALLPEGAATLRAIARQMDLLESHWGEVEAFCAGIPDTLVHGDLAAKNMRLRAVPSGMSSANLAPLVFDWENGGWGLPAVDLCQFTDSNALSPDLESYSVSLGQRGRQLEFWKIRRLAQYGSIFRLLEGIQWAAPKASDESSVYLVDVAIPNLRVYEDRMAQALKAVDWTR